MGQQHTQRAPYFTFPWQQGIILTVGELLSLHPVLGLPLVFAQWFILMHGASHIRCNYGQHVAQSCKCWYHASSAPVTFHLFWDKRLKVFTRSIILSFKGHDHRLTHEGYWFHPIQKPRVFFFCVCLFFFLFVLFFAQTLHVCMYKITCMSARTSKSARLARVCLIRSDLL